MPDETIVDEKPSTELAIVSSEEPEPIEEAQVTAKARLRAFEDETLGADAPRISGQIEKGHGSFFKTKLTDEQRKHHEALERLVVAEAKAAHASAALAAAEAAHEAALAEVEASEVSPEVTNDGDESE